MQTKNLQKPKFRLFVVTDRTVDIKKAKSFVAKRYGAEDISTVQSQNGGGSLVLFARVGNFSNIWKYLTKKRGVVSVRIGN